MSKNYKSLRSVFDQLEEYLKNRYDIRFNNISLLYESSIHGEYNYNELNLERLYVEIERNDIRISFDKLLIYLKATSNHYNPIKNYFHTYYQNGMAMII